jgi:hypothetical protein
VTFTAKVHATVQGSTKLVGKMTGKVTFKDKQKILGTQPLVAGQASMTTSTLSKGRHRISATYSGDENYNPVTSPALIQVVR